MSGPRVVAIGDSVTLGVGDGVQASDGSVGWAAHTARALGAASFTNLAANGVRARHLLAGQIPAALALRPDIALLTVGGNDVLRGDFDPEEIRGYVRTSVTRLREQGAEVVVVLLSHIKLFELFHNNVARAMARRIDRANEALTAALAGTGALVVDGTATMGLLGMPAWHIDRIHPSPRGHRALAERAVALLARFPAAREVEPPGKPAGPARTAWWLLRNGIPWIAKRSRDLVPQIARVVLDELRSERVGAGMRTGPAVEAGPVSGDRQVDGRAR